jgi:hypothetical protein
LKFFEFSLTPSPFLYVATPLPNLAIASLWTWAFS